MVKVREFKFRAWEKNLKEIIPIRSMNFKNKMINTETAWRLFSEVELMQYTGLKDKNGKEVFEGDIVKITSEFPDELHEVKFDCGGFMVGDGFLDDYWNVYGYMFEVIGNIYENPDLLEHLEE